MFTLSGASAHRVHPEVGVHLVGADAGVRGGSAGHRRGAGVRPRAEVRQEPYPPREQHPPHGQREAERSEWRNAMTHRLGPSG